MGCPCELRFDADSEEAFSRAIEPCLREIRRFETKYSRYLPNSVTSAINRAAGVSAVPIDEETASILKYAAVCHEQSDGLFDITSGAFRRVWHPERRTPPSRQELEASAARVGWDKVQFSEREVFLPLPGMELDFGGVVKEYAADSAAMVAGKAGLHHGLVNLGGDIRIVGPQGERASLADWNRPSLAHGHGRRHAVAGGGRGDDIRWIRTVRRDRGATVQPPDRSPERVARGWSVERQRGCEPGGRRGVHRHGRVAAAPGRWSELARAVRSAVSGRRPGAPLPRVFCNAAGLPLMIAPPPRCVSM